MKQRTLPHPLLLAGHGSADSAGAAAFHALRTRVSDLLAAELVDVAGGFIELSAPPLSTAVAALTNLGHRRVVAVPLVIVFLLRGLLKKSPEKKFSFQPTWLWIGLVVLVTFSVAPSAAMMNENSPICARLMPTRNAVRPLWPATNAPAQRATILATTTTAVTTAIGFA